MSLIYGIKHRWERMAEFQSSRREKALRLQMRELERDLLELRALPPTLHRLTLITAAEELLAEMVQAKADQYGELVAKLRQDIAAEGDRTFLEAGDQPGA